MKTTVILKDELAEMLKEFSIQHFKNKKKMSEALNKILSEYFARKKDLFGTSKQFSTKELRDKNDRLDRFF